MKVKQPKVKLSATQKKLVDLIVEKTIRNAKNDKNSLSYRINLALEDIDRGYRKATIKAIALATGKNIEYMEVGDGGRHFPAGMMIVPLESFDGHNYPVGVPTLCNSNGCRSCLRISGKVGNSMGSDQEKIRAATKDEIIQFVKSVNEDTISQHLGIVVV